MEFELKHIMKVNDEELFEDVNSYLQAGDDDTKFESLKDVPENLLLETMDYFNYFDTELESILIEELSITKL